MTFPKFAQDSWQFTEHVLKICDDCPKAILTFLFILQHFLKIAENYRRFTKEDTMFDYAPLTFLVQTTS